MALSICCGLRGGSTEIVGTSSGIAPYRRSRSINGPAWSFVRGTRIRQPNSGFVSNQESASRCSTTEPTTMVADLRRAKLRGEAVIVVGSVVEQRQGLLGVQPAEVELGLGQVEHRDLALALHRQRNPRV